MYSPRVKLFKQLMKGAVQGPINSHVFGFSGGSRSHLSYRRISNEHQYVVKINYSGVSSVTSAIEGITKFRLLAEPIFSALGLSLSSRVVPNESKSGELSFIVDESDLDRVNLGLKCLFLG